MNKYLNKRTEVDGIVFDSKREARYYLVLKDRLTKGEISNLRRQVSYELIPAVYKEETVHLKTKDKVVRKIIQRAITYRADFVYVDNIDGTEKVIDVKGLRTKEYCLKRKMMLALKGISIIEI